jgi:hypothetical protein
MLHLARYCWRQTVALWLQATEEPERKGLTMGHGILIYYLLSISGIHTSNL